VLPDSTHRQRARVLAEEMGLCAAAGQVLLARGIDNADAAQRYLSVGPGDRHDPGTLPDLDGAAKRLVQAIDLGERVVVHGDYDADGISGTALLTRGLRRLGASVEPFVPDRDRDGYGVASRLVEHAGQAEVRVLVTVDTGSNAGTELGRARDLGMDVIVCDHHLFDEAPDGVRWHINPQRPDSVYPHRDLCGAGLALKLLEQVATLRGGLELDAERALAAIATVADQVVLGRENRAIVTEGLACLERSDHPGLRELLRVAGWRGGRLDAEDVAFRVAPRINAPGRIAKAKVALDLLLCDDPRQARELAVQVDALNERRKDVDRRVAESAIERVAAEGLEDRAGLVLGDADWPLGVVGIAAARVVERYGLPTVLLAIEGDIARGSARSARGVDLKACLDRCAEHLQKYGGHAAAAGLTLETSRIGALTEAFDRAVREATVSTEEAGDFAVDALLASQDLTGDFAEFLHRCGPFGTGNRRPCFASLALSSSSSPRVVGKGHLKLQLSDGRRRLGFIGFSMADEFGPKVRHWPRLDVAYHVRYREDSAYDPWDLSLQDIRPTEDGREEAR
jgi:single-stranded-DNA-specific exonuclease